MKDHEDAQNEDLQKEPEPFFSSDTAGKKLAVAREGWGLSVQEVADNLNLGVHIIEAVEADEYDKLPGSTFARGYIRAYANLLRLDPDELIAMVVVKPDQLLEIPMGNGASRFKGRSFGTNRKRSSFFQFVLFVLLFVVLVLFGLNQWFQLDVEKLIGPYKFPASETNESNQEGSGN